LSAAAVRYEGYGIGDDLVLTATLAIVGFPAALLKTTLDQSKVPFPLPQICPDRFGLATQSDAIHVVDLSAGVVFLAIAAIDR
jgi:hypothetical protein